MYHWQFIHLEAFMILLNSSNSLHPLIHHITESLCLTLLHLLWATELHSFPQPTEDTIARTDLWFLPFAFLCNAFKINQERILRFFEIFCVKVIAINFKSPNDICNLKCRRQWTRNISYSIYFGQRIKLLKHVTFLKTTYKSYKLKVLNAIGSSIKIQKNKTFSFHVQLVIHMLIACTF